MLGHIDQASVVDLYAGTGALGIEALSRGASHAHFVERSKTALQCLRRNLDELELSSRSTVLARSVESSGPELIRQGPYDLAFCDPPWSRISDVMLHLDRLTPQRWLTVSGILILEHPAKFEPEPSALSGLTLADQRHWGDTAVTLFTTDRVGELDEIPNRS